MVATLILIAGIAVASVVKMMPSSFVTMPVQPVSPSYWTDTYARVSHVNMEQTNELGYLDVTGLHLASNAPAWSNGFQHIIVGTNTYGRIEHGGYVGTTEVSKYLKFTNDLDLAFETNVPFMVSFWVNTFINPGSFTEFLVRMVESPPDGKRRGYRVYMNASAAIQFRIGHGGTQPGGADNVAYRQTTYTISTSVWQLVSCYHSTNDSGTNAANLYIFTNGVPAALAAIDPNYSAVNNTIVETRYTNILHFGNMYGTAGGTFRGMVDDIRIYSNIHSYVAASNLVKDLRLYTYPPDNRESR